MSMIKRLQKAAVASLCLVGLVLGLTMVPAQAVPQQAGQNAYFSDIYSGQVQSVEQFDSAQLEAIDACLPEQISAENEDIGDRVARAFGEMGNDFLERAFNLKDDPTLSDAEIAFRDCLQSKGVSFTSPVVD
ncbi:MAG: hypothetical protein AAF289_05165 [Cyanobacteria bacterium P01_A01_bin.135]